MKVRFSFVFNTFNMLLLLFILLVKLIAIQCDCPSNETVEELELLNNLQFEHNTRILGHNGYFEFTILNTSYTVDVLNITSYYYSITFFSDSLREERCNTVDIPTNETEHRGKLTIEHIQEGGNYIVCVMFLKNNRMDLVASSRFCHIVSAGDSCHLELNEMSFTDQPAYFLMILVVVILVIVVIGSYVRAYIYRPRTYEDFAHLLPLSHTAQLEDEAGRRIIRRLRGKNLDFDNHIRNASIYSIDEDVYLGNHIDPHMNT